MTFNSQAADAGASGTILGRLASLPVTLAPGRSLLKYYTLMSLAAGPGFPFLFAFLFFRWRTLRYELDDEGLTMRWGVLYRREISLSYARIQDIHLSSNVVERWLGLGKIQVQTASGSSGAEMKIEGLEDVDAVRDFLYSRMRGAGETGARAGASVGARAGTRPELGGSPNPAAAPTGLPDPALSELTAILRDVAREVRALRESLSDRDGPADDR